MILRGTQVIVPSGLPNETIIQEFGQASVTQAVETLHLKVVFHRKRGRVEVIGIQRF